MSRDRGTPNRTPARRNATNRRSRASRPITRYDRSSSSRTTVAERPIASPTDRQRRQQLSQPVSLRRRAFNLITDWRFFTLVGLSLTGGLTALSIAFIFKMPALPNCPSVFWPLASASLRLHCAQLAASKQTVPDLLEGIKLLNSLGEDHPLYKASSQLIEDWSAQILDLAEKDFQSGKIKSAIAGARQIPKDSAAAKLVEDRIKRWEKIWSKAQTIYNKAGEVLKKANLQEAQVYAARLLSIDNEYWQTTKYEQLNKLVLATRKDITRLGKAERALKRLVVDDIVTSLQEVSGILKQSFVYKDAQQLIPKLGRKLLDLAESALARKDYSTALDIANRIPGNVNLGKEVDDFRLIAQAQSKAWSGGILNLEDAIEDAEKIKPGRPSYDKAQRLIGRWQVQIREVARLDAAKKLAAAGDLQNAIVQASQLSSSNQAAQDFLRQTTGQVQDQEDRPILDRAEQYAMYGDADSLENAIAEAKKIGSQRSLYREARNRIKMWTTQLQGLREQTTIPTNIAAEPVPAVTATSIGTANSGNTVSDVAVPSPEEATLNSERALLQQAKDVAGAGTADALMQAIGMVQGIPDGSVIRPDAVASIDQWSQQMVQSAQYQAEFDVVGAINIAQRVPPGTSGYANAQALLKQWRALSGQ